MNITFKPFQEEDLSLLQDWLREPLVMEFWHEPEDEEVLRAKYLSKLQDRGLFPFIIQIDQIPVGYIQYYEACHIGGGWWTDAKVGIFGIDLFIGDPNSVGKGLGPIIIGKFIQLLCKTQPVREIIVDPDPKNLRAIRAYEKVGFKTQGEVSTPNGKACLMKLVPKSNLKTIVLTGGPGVGKTSIIQNLMRQNYEVRDEVFTHLFAKAQSEGRFNDAFLHSPELIHDLIQAQIELEDIPCRSGLIFLDRSRVDILGFSKNMGITPFEKDRRELASGHYDLFFVINPIPRKYYDQNEIRRQSYEESLEHHTSIIQHYQDYIKSQKRSIAECLIEVPFHDSDPANSVKRRTDFILEAIERLNSNALSYTSEKI